LLVRVHEYLLIVHPTIYRPGDDTIAMIDAIHKEVRKLSRREKALDMGCGCGILSLILAKYFKKVIAVDVNPLAVKYTILNAYINGCRERIVGICSNLFNKVNDIDYDMITFNIPYLIGAHPYDLAYSGTIDLVKNFLKEASYRISQIGVILFTWRLPILAESMWFKIIKDLLRTVSLRWDIVVNREVSDERIIVIKAMRG